MIIINENKTTCTGKFEDIISESQAGIFNIIELIRNEASDEFATEFMGDLVLLFNGYADGLVKRKSHDECMIMAIKMLKGVN